MPFFGYYLDPTWLLLLPAILLSAWAQWQVSSSFNRYARTLSAGGQICSGRQPKSARYRSRSASEGFPAITGFTPEQAAMADTIKPVWGTRPRSKASRVN